MLPDPPPHLAAFLANVAAQPPPITWFATRSQGGRFRAELLGPLLAGVTYSAEDISRLIRYSGIRSQTHKTALRVALLRHLRQDTPAGASPLPTAERDGLLSALLVLALRTRHLSTEPELMSVFQQLRDAMGALPEPERALLASTQQRTLALAIAADFHLLRPPTARVFALLFGATDADTAHWFGLLLASLP